MNETFFSDEVNVDTSESGEGVSSDKVFGRLINALVNHWTQRLGTNADGLVPERIYSLFEETMAEFDSYSRDPYQIQFDSEGKPIWGEDKLLKLFGYGNDYAYQHGISQSESVLRVDNNSFIGSLLNAYRWKNEFDEQLKNINKKCDPQSFEARKLITLCGLILRAKLGEDAQFTYAGERYIAAVSALDSKLRVHSGNYVNAVPFRHADTLCKIDSIRLIEKIEQQIVKIESNSYDGKGTDIRSNDGVIRIAAFGSFCDKPAEGEKHNIETLAEEGFFKSLKYEKKTYKVEIAYFELIREGVASAVYREVDKTVVPSDLLQGDLYDPDFLGRTVSSKYDIICLLDMGSLYSDTSRGLKLRSVTPFEEAWDNIRSVEVQKSRYGIKGISVRAYTNLYLSYLRWIEYAFYGKSHLFEFDAKLFAVLSAVSNRIDSRCSVFTYLSRNRGPMLSEVKPHDNLCRDEFYFGRSIVVYDWSSKLPEKSKRIESKCDSLMNKWTVMESDRPSVMRIRFWKILKSLDDYYYSKAFTSAIFKDDSSSINKYYENSEADIEFVRFLTRTDALFDYSAVATSNKVRYALVSDSNDSRAKVYLRVCNKMLDAILKLGFDRDGYENCSSALCKSVIINAMHADATNAEQLVLVSMLDRRYSNSPSLERIETVVIDTMSRDKESDPTIKRMKQKFFAALYDAIMEINGSNNLRRDQAEDIIIKAFADEKAGENPDNILYWLGQACKELGYTECALYKCSL